MNIYVDLGGSEALTLKGALLIYRGKSRSFVAWHEARNSGQGAPYLGEAQPLTTEFVHGLAHSLGSRVPVEVFPENVLVRTAETVVWWTPAVHRTMFFRSADEDTQILNGKRFPHPPLVWRVSHGELWVRALPENSRPKPATKLCVAPYFNVSGEDGLTCQGTMRSPEDAGVATIPLWERAFFQSEFTHQTGTRRLTIHPGGFLGLWASLAGSRERFQVEHLAPTNQTLLEFATQAAGGG